ncbi:MAG: hypothetical protein H0V08_02755 [Thermoleophilaceae bacterium]|nr:hypothetical protein [Thermoleophilaceae bacterium]
MYVGTATQGHEPEWEPLLAAVGEEVAGDFMWMFEVELSNGVRLLYLDHGEWVAAVLDSSDRDAYIESLELIRTLDFDVLVPWIATGGQPFHAVTDETDAKARIDAILERLRRGETR